MIIDHSKLRLSRRDEMVVNRYAIGLHQCPLLVVDNFYQQPDYVRQLALSLRYEDRVSGHGGTHAQARISLDDFELRNFISEQFGRDWGLSQNVHYHQQVPDHTWSFRRSFDSNQYNDSHLVEENPHSDGPVALAGLIYLNTSEQCKGGTATVSALWQQRHLAHAP